MIDLSSYSTDVAADFIETLALAQYPRPVSNQSAREQCESLANINPVKFTNAFNLLAKRKTTLRERYPFIVTSEYVCAEADFLSKPYSSYLLMSAPSLVRTAPSWNLSTSAKFMEVISEKSFTSFYGEGTKTVNFGFPSKIGRPASFADAITWLSQLTRLPVGSGYKPARRQDGGVDLFVWKSFPDMQPGVPILLIQCTIQENYLDKISDVDRRLWASWLSSDIDPTVGLAVPNMVTKSDTWADITTRGLLFDRNRLCLMAGVQDFSLELTEQAYLSQLLHELALELT